MIEEILAPIFYAYMGLVYGIYTSFVAGFMYEVIKDAKGWLKRVIG